MALQYLAKEYRVGITGRRGRLLNELKQKFPSQIFTACFDVRCENNVENLRNLIKEIPKRTKTQVSLEGSDFAATPAHKVEDETANLREDCLQLHRYVVRTQPHEAEFCAR